MRKATNDAADVGNVANLRDMGEPRGKTYDRTEEADSGPAVEKDDSAFHRQTEVCIFNGCDWDNTNRGPRLPTFPKDLGKVVGVIAIDAKTGVGKPGSFQ